MRYLVCHPHTGLAGGVRCHLVCGVFRELFRSLGVTVGMLRDQKCTSCSSSSDGSGCLGWESKVVIHRGRWFSQATPMPRHIPSISCVHSFLHWFAAIVWWNTTRFGVLGGRCASPATHQHLPLWSVAHVLLRHDVAQVALIASWCCKVVRGGKAANMCIFTQSKTPLLHNNLHCLSPCCHSRAMLPYCHIRSHRDWAQGDTMLTS